MSFAPTSALRDRRDGILPDQWLRRHLLAEVAADGPHVTMRELEPRPGERVGKRFRVLEEAARDLLVRRVEPQREVGGQHRRRVTLRRVVGVGHGTFAHPVLRLPLVRARRALGQLPLVAEEIPEEVVAPPRGRRGPGHLEAAGDGVASLARAVAADPPESLCLEGRRLGFWTDVSRRACPMGLAEGVPSGDERDRLLVVHRHARERLADVTRGRHRVGVTVRSFRVDVDEAHLHSRERIGELAIAAVARVLEPRRLVAPVDFRRLPHVLAPAAEPERLEPHGLEGDVTGEDHQVGPRDLPAVLLLDRPQQATRLVEIGVVGPAVERRESLLARTRATAAVVDAVGAGAVPGHADEKRSVVPEVGWPPGLRRRHQLLDVLLQRIEIEGLELGGVVERRPHGIASGRVLVQNLQVQLVRPPVSVRPAAVCVARERALRFGVHVDVDLYCGGGGADAALRWRRGDEAARGDARSRVRQSGHRPQ